MAEEKVYTPEVVDEVPFPTEQEQILSVSDSESGGTYSPAKTQPTPFKQKVVSHETLAQSLNTRSRKVLQEFDLIQSGGFKVGDFKEGISGDLRITPNGLTARDIAGNTTFAIDGTTGDATFKGTVQAADFTVIDENGLVSLSSFFSETISSNEFALGPPGETFPTWDDVEGTEMTFTLERPTKVLILFNAGVSITRIDASTGTSQVQVILNIDGQTQDQAKIRQYVYGAGNGVDDGPIAGSTNGFHYLADLDKGTHTIKVQWRQTNDYSVERGHIWEGSFTYLLLGR